MNWKDDPLSVSSTVPCNCRWMECPAHPDRLCSHMAAYVDKCVDEDCHDVHFLGDVSLGEDIHICTGCADAIVRVLLDELLALMQDVSHIVPPYLKPLETFVREVYKTSSTSLGWLLPQDDAMAVLSFASAVFHIEADKTPIELIERADALAMKIIQISKAFEDTQLKGVQS